uniref:Uncharacterized protein n=1 Tax=Corethron hystrix TaxID=216773 RepID=A0A7S1FKQ0_9STRA|mmetsp:Transcript_11893/g.26080  ORF Transcript_11893/g.26080 Transcript_11893/m.26080 type:complete len:184 (+) Transcript_11893:147-698(+)
MRAHSIDKCVVSLLLATQCYAFSPSVSVSVRPDRAVRSVTYQHRRITSIPSSPHSTLRLFPEQGTQLVAASCASNFKDHEDKTESTTQATHNLLSRIFRNSNSNEDKSYSRTPLHSRFSLLMRGITNHEDDEVFYPLVGFKWVENDNKYYFVTPVTKSSCALHTHSAKEELYGWYSPACFLED